MYIYAKCLTCVCGQITLLTSCCFYFHNTLKGHHTHLSYAVQNVTSKHKNPLKYYYAHQHTYPKVILIYNTIICSSLAYLHRVVFLMSRKIVEPSPRIIIGYTPYHQCTQGYECEILINVTFFSNFCGSWKLMCIIC